MSFYTSLMDRQRQEDDAALRRRQNLNGWLVGGGVALCSVAITTYFEDAIKAITGITEGYRILEFLFFFGLVACRFALLPK